MTHDYEYSFERMRAANGNAASDGAYLTWFLQQTRAKIRAAKEQAEKIADLADWDPIEKPNGVGRLADLHAYLRVIEDRISGLVVHFTHNEQLRTTFKMLYRDARSALDAVQGIRTHYRLDS